jgi:hypothetical protein
MSTDARYWLIETFFGIDRHELDAFFHRLGERYIQPVARFLQTLPQRPPHWVEDVARPLHANIQHIASAPEIEGHERLLVEVAGYSPIGAKFMTRYIHHWGELYAAEINEGRRVSTLVARVAKAAGQSTLVVSRRAKQLSDGCRSVEARDLIGRAVEEAELSVTAAEFAALVRLACQRDAAACRWLGSVCQQLRPHLPEKCGRPISRDACIQLFLLRHLESRGLKRAYTWTEKDGIDDFADRVTQASRLAFDNPRFSPHYANRLHKDDGRLSPVIPMVSAATEEPLPPERHGLNPRKSLR